MKNQEPEEHRLLRRERITCKLVQDRTRGWSNRAATVQDYQTLKNECLSSGRLFEDPVFPPERLSIEKGPRGLTVEWKRPHEICFGTDPMFFVDGVSRFDIVQGELGDCWLLSTVSVLAQRTELYDQVIPTDQSFQRDYAGIFHFRFWQYGKWVDVVVDDRLPTCENELIFMRSSQPNEFWSPLLEKAYAKLNGSYDALIGGIPTESMVDMTGGIAEFYELDDLPEELADGKLYNLLLQASSKRSLLTCSTSGANESVKKEGIITGHAYGITGVEVVETTDGEKVQLLRIRNPWGNKFEWNGPWSDNSNEWNLISDEWKRKIGLVKREDGEFWITFSDWLKHFKAVEICSLSLEGFDNEVRTNLYRGEWKGSTAGGCLNNKESFFNNPQYLISLGNDSKLACEVLLALTQENRLENKPMNPIGMIIYKISRDATYTTPLNKEFFMEHRYVKVYQPFLNHRDIMMRVTLPPGKYVVIPSTFEPGCEGKFILRVVSDDLINFKEHDQHLELKDEPDSIKPNNDKHENTFIDGLFNRFAGSDNEINWKELQEILDYSGISDDIYPEKRRVSNSLFCCFGSSEPRSFSKDVCRSLVAVKDHSRSGKLNKDEFMEIWSEINHWKDIFYQYDVDKSGFLSPFELRNALNSAGFNMNNSTLIALCYRFTEHNKKIPPDDFIMCAIKLNSAIKTFNKKADQGKVTFNIHELVEAILYS